MVQTVRQPRPDGIRETPRIRKVSELAVRIVSPLGLIVGSTGCLIRSREAPPDGRRRISQFLGDGLAIPVDDHTTGYDRDNDRAEDKPLLRRETVEPRHHAGQRLGRSIVAEAFDYVSGTLLRTGSAPITIGSGFGSFSFGSTREWSSCRWWL